MSLFSNRIFRLPVHDYDLGWRRNFAKVFGTTNLILALMPSQRPPVGDGIVWDTCRSLVSIV